MSRRVPFSPVVLAAVVLALVALLVLASPALANIPPGAGNPTFTAQPANVVAGTTSGVFTVEFQACNGPVEFTEPVLTARVVPAAAIEADVRVSSAVPTGGPPGHCDNAGTCVYAPPNPAVYGSCPNTATYTTNLRVRVPSSAVDVNGFRLEVCVEDDTSVPQCVTSNPVNVRQGGNLRIEKIPLTLRAAPGDTALFKVTIYNDGPSDAAGVTISDFPQAGFAGIGTIVAPLEAWDLLGPGVYIPAGQHVEALVSAVVSPFTPPSPPLIWNCAALNIPGGFNDRDGGDDDTCAPLWVYNDPLPPASLGLEKYCEGPGQGGLLVPGMDFTCVLTVTNTGDTFAEGVNLEESFWALDPYVIEWQQYPVPWTCGSDLSCSRGGVMPDGAVETIEARFLCPADAHLSPAFDLPFAPYPYNDATVVADNPGAIAFASYPLGFDPQVNLRAEKVALTPQVVVSGTALFKVTIYNDGPSDADGVTITDTLGAGWVPGSLVIAPTEAITPGLYVPAGGHTEVFVSAQVDPAAPVGPITDTVTVIVPPDVTDTNAGDNSATAEVDVLAASALPPTSLDVYKVCTGPGPGGELVPGTIFNCVFTIKNTGPNAAEGVSLNDAFFGIEPYIVSIPDVDPLGTWSCGSDLSCSREGSMPANVTETIEFELFLPADAHLGPSGLQLNNFVYVVADNPDSWDVYRLGLVVDPEADLSIDKTLLTPGVAPGSTALFEVVVRNNGTSDVDGVDVDDVVTGPGLVIATSPDLNDLYVPAGQTRDIMVSVQISDTAQPGDIITNCAEVLTGSLVAADYTVVNAPIEACAEMTVGPYLPETDMSISKSLSAPSVVAGDKVRVTLTITNNGPAVAEDVTVQDLFMYPAMVDNWDSTDGNWTCDGGVTCFRRAPMPPGTEEISFDLHVPADQAPGLYYNVAQVSADNPDPDWVYPGTDNYDVVPYDVTAEADLGISKSVIKDELCLGSYGFYVIDVTNYGPSAAEDIVVTDVLSDALVFGGGGCTHDGSPTGGTVTCTLDYLDVGDSHTFLIGFNLAPDVVDQTVIENPLVAVTSATGEPAQNVYPDVLRLAAPFTAVQCFLPETDMQISKSVAPSPPGYVWAGGAPLRVTLTITNAGLHWAEGVVVQDLNPYGDVVNNFSLPPGWSCDSGVTCVRQDPMPPDGPETISFDLYAPPERPMQLYPNQAHVTADNPDPVGGNNWSAVVPYGVRTRANLSIVKNALADQIVAGGDAVPFSIVVTNNGPSDANDVIVRDAAQAPFFYLAGSLVPGDGPMACAGNVCSIARIPVGESAEIYAMIGATPDAPVGVQFADRAAVVDTSDWQDNTPQLADASIEVVAEADMWVEKTGPITVTAGATFTYTITLDNEGPSLAQAVQVVDTLPYGVLWTGVWSSPVAGLVCAGPPQGPVVCHGPGPSNFGPHHAVKIYLQVVADPNACYEGKVDNLVEVSSETTDPDPANNDEDWGTIILSDAGVTIGKTVVGPVTAGGTATFQLEIHNDGPGCASDVKVVDELGAIENPVGLAMVSYDASQSTQGGVPPLTGYWYSCSGGAACQRGAPLPAGDTDVITITVEVPADTPEGVYSNWASVVWDSGSAESNQEFYNVDTEAHVEIAKHDLWDPAIVGGLGDDTVVYLIVVHNEGPSTAYNVVVTDTFPAGMALGEEIIVDAAYLGAPSSCGGFPCVVGDIPAGETAELYVVASVDATVTGCDLEVTNWTGVTWEDTFQSSTPAVTETTTLECQEDLDLKKTGPLTADVGELITYTLRVANTGPSPVLTGELRLEDQLPAGLDVSGYDAGACGFALVGGGLPAGGSQAVFTNTVALNAGEECRLEVSGTISESVCPAGQIFNEAQVYGPSGSMDQALWPTFVDCSTTLTVTKTPQFGGAPVAGTVVDFNIVVKNTGDVTAFGPELTDNILAPYPTGAQVVDFAIIANDFGWVGNGGECSNAGFCNLPDIPPGKSLTVLASVQIDSDQDGVILRQNACVDADNARTADNPDGQACARYDGEIVSEASLVISKKDLYDPVMVDSIVGDDVTYIIRVRNDGPSDAENVVVHDTLQVGMQPSEDVIIVPSWGGMGMSCQTSPAHPQEVLCDLGTIPAGEMVELYLVASVNRAGLCDTRVTNNVEASWDDDVGPGNHTVSAPPETTDIVCRGDLDLKKTGPREWPMDANGIVSYTLRVTNPGPSPIPVGELTLTDQVPAGLAFAGWREAAGSCGFAFQGQVDDQLSWRNDGGALLVGSACEIEVGFSVADDKEVCTAGVIWNEAQAYAYESEVQTGWLTVVDCGTELDVEKWIEDGEPVAGGTMVFGISVTNEGLVTAYDVKLTDNMNIEERRRINRQWVWVPLPTGAKIIDFYSPQLPAGACTDAGFCNVGDLAAGEAITVYATVQFDSDLYGYHQRWRQEACVSADNAGRDCEELTGDYERDVQLDIDKDDLGFDIVAGGDQLIYLITVRNDGLSDAYLIGLHDFPAPNFDLVGLVEPKGDSLFDPVECNILGCTIGHLPAGESLQFYATLRAEPDAEPGYELEVNEACVYDNLIDWFFFHDPVDCDVEETTVLVQADLAVEKDATPTVVAGEQITYTLEVYNNGPSDAVGVVLTDALPAGVEYDAAKSDARCSESLGIVTCENDPPDNVVEAGEEVEYTIVVTVPSDVLPGWSLENVAEVESATPDPDESNNEDDADTSIVAETGLVLEKTGPITGTAGMLIEYTIVVTNNGPSVAQLVDIKDDLPDEVNFYDAYVTRSGDGPDGLCGGPVCEVVDVAVLESLTVHLKGFIDSSVQAGAVLTNTAGVFVDSDPEPDDNDWVTTTVETQSEMVIEKHALADDIVAGDEEVLYSIQVYNGGPSDAYNVVITDTPDAGLQLIDLDPGDLPMTCSVDTLNNTGICEIPWLPALQSMEIYATVEALADAPTGVYTNTACISNTRTVPEGQIIFWSPVTPTLAPEDMLGPYTMLTVTDTRGTGTFPSDNTVITVPVAIGEVAFDQTMGHCTVGESNSCWATWSHGYTGDVYVTDGISIVITLPPNTGAFYLYVQPAVVSAFPMTVTADGALSEPIVVSGDKGASYFGFYATGDAYLTSITVQIDPAHPGFAVGEFGIAEKLDFSLPLCAYEPIDLEDVTDLAVLKTGPLTVTAGMTYTYEVTVYNNGPSDAISVTVTDTLPFGVVYVTDTAPITFCTAVQPGVVSCEVGDVQADEPVTFTITVQADPSVCYEGKVNNVIEVAGALYDPDPANNRSEWGTVVLNQVDLTLEKVVIPDPVTAGLTMTVLLTATNEGPGCATGVEIRDALWEQLGLEGWAWYTEDAADYECTAGVDCIRTLPMQPGATDVLALLITVPADTEPSVDDENFWYNNWAYISSNDREINPDDNEAYDDYDVAAWADLEVDKEAPEEVEPSATFNYLIQVTNDGPSDAQGVVVTDTLDDNVEYVNAGGNASPGCEFDEDDNAVICEVETLPAGAIASFIVTVRAGDVPSGTVLYNHVVVSSETPDPDEDNNWDDEESTVRQELEHPSADLSIEKEAKPEVVKAGEYVTFTLTVSNAGPLVATRVVVKDALPDGLKVVSIEASNPHDTPFCDGERECDLGKVFLDAGAVVTVVAQVDIDYEKPSLTNLAYVENYGDEYDNNADNDFATETVWITSTPTADLALVKRSTPTARPGDIISYTLTVYNDGPADAENVVVTDWLPDGVEFVDASAGCSYDAGSRILTCVADVLEKDGEIAFGATAQVDEGVPLGSSLENVAEVESDALETDPSDNGDTADTSIIRNYGYYLPIILRSPKPAPLPDLSVRFNLEPDKTSFGDDEEVLVKVYVTNEGDAPAGPFWVDFYINPSPVPTAQDILWEDTCTMSPCYGIGWQVEGLGIGESILLTSEPGSYDAMVTNWMESLPAGTTDLYVRVNTYNPAGRTSPFGVSVEKDYGNNLFARHGLTVSAVR